MASENRLAKLRTSRTYCFNAGFSGVPNGELPQTLAGSIKPVHRSGVIISDFRTMQVAAPAGEIIVQGFREEAGQYVFVRETGDSAFGIMDERKFQLLRSPLPNQIWVLITGQMGGFMGDLERVRIYSFDGVDFQERWAPEDSLNTELTVNGDEISSRYLEFKRRYLRGEEECIEEHVKLLQTGVTRTNLTRHGVCGDPRRIKLPGAIK